MESKENKYFKWYWSICERAKDRVLESSIYTEKHHIYPKSIYGQNKNLVRLTAKEHYIVHLLLWRGFRYKYGTKDTNTRKMAYAFTMMNNPGLSGKRYKIKNANEYSYIRIAYREAPLDSKKNNSNKPKTIEHKKKLSESLKGRVPWNKGKKDVYSDETKKKWSEKRKGKATWNKGKILSHKKCYKYNKNTGKFLKKYDSIRDASDDTNINYSSISLCCKKLILTAGGYIWTFDFVDSVTISKKHTNGKKIYKLDFDNNIIEEYNTLTMAAKINNISISAISACLTNRNKSAGGFKWKFKIL